MNHTYVTPDITVELGGAKLADPEIRLLDSVRVRVKLSCPSQCELTFRQDLSHLEDLPLPEPGDSLEVAIRDQNQMLFSGKVTAIEYEYGPSGGHVIRVRGYDPLYDLRKRHPVRTHVQMTLAELAEEIASETGYSVEAQEEGPLMERLIQYDQDDLRFLVSTAARYGFYLAPRGDTLHLITLAGLDRHPVSLALGENLFEAHMELNDQSAYGSARSTGWAMERTVLHSGHCDAARNAGGVPDKAASHRSGADSDRPLVDRPIRSDSEAEGIAQGELDRTTGAMATCWGVTEGVADLQPGTPVEIEGVEPSFCGRYVLTDVIHRIDAEHGYVCEFSSRPPELPQRNTGPNLTAGKVVDVDDPDGLGRVNVALPAHSNCETGWLNVILPGAGADKGLIALPRVEDLVLVLSPSPEPADGVVLGGFFGPEGPSDAGVDGDGVERFILKTPGGQRLLLDDANDTLKLENSSGGWVELAPDGVRVHAETALDIEAPGNAITIRGATIDFERK